METGETNIPIDVQKIVKEIQEEIKEKGLTDDLPKFQSLAPGSSMTVFDKDFFTESLYKMNSGYKIAAYRHLNGTKIMILIKRVLRKLMKFYIEPITYDVSNFNTYTVQTMNQVGAYINTQKDYEERIIALESEVEKLTKQLDRGKKQE